MPGIQEDQKYRLELGEVGVIAEVALNGETLQTVWTDPWSVNLGEQLKQGPNRLEIRVTNTWNNRLVADSHLPEDQRVTYVSEPYRKPGNDALLPSGLMGPVLIEGTK